MGIVAEFDTEYSHYRVEDETYNARPARILYGGDKVVAQSGIPRDGKPEPLFDYNQRFRELVLGVRPKHILILGGGAFTLPSQLIRERKLIRVDVVELDGALLDISKQHFGLRSNKRLTVYIGDGSQYLIDTDSTYDMIIMDVFHEAVIPNSFQTVAFADHLHQCLVMHGMVAINVIASLQGRNSIVLRTMYAVLQTVFPVVQIFPADRDYSLWMSQNYIVVAHDGSVNPAPHLNRSPVELL